MIGELFKALLITSLAGSVLAVVISLLRPITKRFSGIRGIITYGCACFL